MIFGKFVAKNRAFANNIIFLQFFSVWGNSNPRGIVHAHSDYLFYKALA